MGHSIRPTLNESIMLQQAKVDALKKQLEVLKKEMRMMIDKERPISRIYTFNGLTVIDTIWSKEDEEKFSKDKKKRREIEEELDLLDMFWYDSEYGSHVDSSETDREELNPKSILELLCSENPASVKPEVLNIFKEEMQNQNPSITTQPLPDVDSLSIPKPDHLNLTEPTPASTIPQLTIPPPTTLVTSTSITNESMIVEELPATCWDLSNHNDEEFRPEPEVLELLKTIEEEEPYCVKSLEKSAPSIEFVYPQEISKWNTVIDDPFGQEPKKTLNLLLHITQQGESLIDIREIFRIFKKQKYKSLYIFFTTRDVNEWLTLLIRGTFSTDFTQRPISVGEVKPR